ncbi:MAG: glycosyl hydrolase [bacterium]
MPDRETCRCSLGAYVNGLENLESFQELIGQKLAVVLFYVHWGEPFPLADVQKIAANGSVPLLTWELWVREGLDDLLSGKYDIYIRDFLGQAKDCGQQILLRPMHEMNGNWYPWDGWHNGQGSEAAAKYKKAWLFIYSVREGLKAGNVKLVWSPNHEDLPAVDWNKMANYYPGDQYVDWVGLDGYNWGHGKWESFERIFDCAYRILSSLSSKPMMIGEFGSAENGGSKAEWIKDAFERIKNSYPKVKIVCWFNINKERDWRVDSSNSALKSFRRAIKDSHFSQNLL